MSCVPVAVVGNESSEMVERSNVDVSITTILVLLLVINVLPKLIVGLSHEIKNNTKMNEKKMKRYFAICIFLLMLIMRLGSV